jgi:hypothetical protein
MCIGGAFFVATIVPDLGILRNVVSPATVGMGKLRTTPSGDVYFGDEPGQRDATRQARAIEGD